MPAHSPVGAGLYTPPNTPYDHNTSTPLLGWGDGSADPYTSTTNTHRTAGGEILTINTTTPSLQQIPKLRTHTPCDGIGFTLDASSVVAYQSFARDICQKLADQHGPSVMHVTHTAFGDTSATKTGTSTVRSS